MANAVIFRHFWTDVLPMYRDAPVGLVGTVDPAMVPHSDVGRAGVVTHVTFIHFLLADTICRKSTHTDRNSNNLCREF